MGVQCCRQRDEKNTNVNILSCSNETVVIPLIDVNESLISGSLGEKIFQLTCPIRPQRMQYYEHKLSLDDSICDDCDYNAETVAVQQSDPDPVPQQALFKEMTPVQQFISVSDHEITPILSILRNYKPHKSQAMEHHLGSNEIQLIASIENIADSRSRTVTPRPYDERSLDSGKQVRVSNNYIPKPRSMERPQSSRGILKQSSSNGKSPLSSLQASQQSINSSRLIDKKKVRFHLPRSKFR